MCNAPRWIALLLAAALNTSAAAGDLAPTQGLDVEGTAFVLRKQDGVVLKGAALRGMSPNVAMGDRIGTVRLSRITPDPDDADILRHEFERQDVDGRWRLFCDAHFEGETWGHPRRPFRRGRSDLRLRRDRQADSVRLQALGQGSRWSGPRALLRRLRADDPGRLRRRRQDARG